MDKNTEQSKQQQQQKPQSAAEIKKLLKGVVSSGYTPIYVNSLKEEVGFKEVTVSQQKTLSKIMAVNENRKDIIYDAQCAIINETALMDGFNIYDYTELDRIKILIALYQNNMFNNEVSFTCKNCGTENKYKLDFNTVIKKLDDLVVDPIDFKYKNKNLEYQFKVQYPPVKLVSMFHKQYNAKHKANSKSEVKVNDAMSNMEYVNLFIRSFDIIDESGNTCFSIDFKGYGPADIEDILQDLPQDVLYSENGVLQFVSNELLKKLNSSFEKHVCMSCQTVQEEENTNQVESFL